MIHFKIECSNPASQFLEIEFSFFCHNNEQISLQLPSWRAGRYQLANYAQNIRKFEVLGSSGKKIPFQKTSKDLWRFYSFEENQVTVSYEYWAGKMDAGSAWIDDEQIYVNLVNCCFEILGKSHEPIELCLNLPNFSEQISTLIPKGKSIWKATDFQMLADSTILATKKLGHWTYQIDSILFHIWIQGEIHFDKRLFLDRFKAFSAQMILDFGEFPEKEYHYIFQLLPYTHYHGVEHRRGTVITFGPAKSLNDSNQMEELLGISSHELYHAWNVCRIRPKELLPYNFSEETYTRAGLILEGITTYMGDFYLLKSGVYDLPTYLKHLQKIFNREAAQFGWKNYTILESSHDLWLDGYVPGIPDRKVNIYTRGALLAFGIDLILIKSGTSLPKVMKLFWEKFGKPFIGYEWKDFENLIFGSILDPQEIREYFSDYVYGKQELFPKLKNLLSELGLEWIEKTGEDKLLHFWGIRSSTEGQITQIHPEAKAHSLLMKNDRILNPSQSIVGDFLFLKIDRMGRTIEFQLPKEANTFFPEIFLEPIGKTSFFERWMA